MKWQKKVTERKRQPKTQELKKKKLTCSPEGSSEAGVPEMQQ